MARHATCQLPFDEPPRWLQLIWQFLALLIGGLAGPKIEEVSGHTFKRGLAVAVPAAAKRDNRFNQGAKALGLAAPLSGRLVSGQLIHRAGPPVFVVGCGAPLLPGFAPV